MYKMEGEKLGVGIKGDSTTAGFEPTRAEPTRFRVWRLNHSAMLPKFKFSDSPAAGVVWPKTLRTQN